MVFQSAVRFLGEKLVDILKFMVKFDGYQETIFGWFFIVGIIMMPIIILIVINDIGVTLKVEAREKEMKKL